jgi:hypothetical protein
MQRSAANVEIKKSCGTWRGDEVAVAAGAVEGASGMNVWVGVDTYPRTGISSVLMRNRVMPIIIPLCVSR